MNETDLNRMLKHAAATPAAGPQALQTIMARVRVDDGRAKRWRSFVQWLLILAAISAMVTAGMVGWSLASKDTTHTKPPAMDIFQEGLTR